MSERPHSAPEGHDGEMSCETLLAALDDVTAKRITHLDFVILGYLVKGLRSRAEIAAAADCAPTSVPRSMKRLEACGYVTRTQGGGRGKASTFAVVENCNRSPEATVLNCSPREIQAPEATVSALNRAPEVSEEVLNRRRAASVSVLKADKARSVSESTGAGAGAKTLNNLDDSNTQLYPDTGEFDFNSRASEKPAKVLNGTAATLPAHVLAGVLVDQVNSPWLDPSRSQRLITTQGMIAKWIEAGADFDADILPTVRVVMRGKSDHVRTWSYFDAAVRQAAADRKRAELPMEIITASEARTNVQSPRPSRQRSVSMATRLLMPDILGGSQKPE